MQHQRDKQHSGKNHNKEGDMKLALELGVLFACIAIAITVLANGISRD